MQISGATDFFSKITLPNRSSSTQKSGFSPAQAAARLQTDVDSLFISDEGRKLSLNARNESTSVEEQSQKTDITDPVLELLDNGMSKMKSILEQMHELAITASNENITDIDRVNMQIELENLRNELAAIPKRMLSQEQGGETIALSDMPLDLMHTNALYAGDGSSMLERMKERITNGQEWNVREAWLPTGFNSNDGKWVVVDDKNVLTQSSDGEDKFATLETDQKVPTVLERLEKETPIILMDAASAAEGAKILERRIDSVQKWRDSIAELSVSNQSNSADKATISSKDMLIQAINYFGNDSLFSGSSLTIPDAPQYFSYSDGVYSGIKIEKAVEVDISNGAEFLRQKNTELEGSSISRAETERDAAEYAAEEERWISANMVKYNGMKITLNPVLGQLFSQVA